METEENMVNEKKSSEVSSDKMENLIQDTTKQLEEIKVSLSDKATEVDELHTIALEQEKKFQEELSKVQEELVKKESLIKELQEALEKATKAKEEAITELNRMKEEALLNERLRKLHDLKILRSGEEARIKQAEKIRSMTEEEFTEYTEDLLDVQSQANNSANKKSAEPAEEIPSETVDKLADEATNTVHDEQAKAKLREILSTLKNDTVEQETGKTEINPAEEKVEEVQKEKASTTLPEVALLQEAFFNILKIKNNDKEGM